MHEPCPHALARAIDRPTTGPPLGCSGTAPRAGLAPVERNRPGRRPPLPHTAGGERGDLQGDLAVHERRRPVPPPGGRGRGDLTTAKVTLSIDATSIDTGIGLRDNHLRSEDFFDVRQFPTITFQSLRVEGAGRRATVLGRLSLHGVAREIAVPVDIDLTSPALVATGELVINRRDYGITYQSFLNPIGNEVRVAFTFRARAA